jgi:hypothetical protein
MSLAFGSMTSYDVLAWLPGPSQQHIVLGHCAAVKIMSVSTISEGAERVFSRARQTTTFDRERWLSRCARARLLRSDQSSLVLGPFTFQSAIPSAQDDTELEIGDDRLVGI